MPRRTRTFRPGAFDLERRDLLSGLAGPRFISPPQVGFVVNSPDGSIQVSQNSASASVNLWRSDTHGFLMVRVQTVPSAAVGVNLAALDQTVTFKPGQTQAAVQVPIITGARNPREVDASLTLVPLNPPPNLINGGPVELRIMANDALVPPTILAAHRTRQGIELTFSKPMDPVRAASAANYALRGSNTKKSDTKSILSAVFLGKWSGIGNTTYSGNVRIRSASYDPATRTVTLVPARPIDPSAQLVVTSGLQSHRRLRARSRSQTPLPLTDLSGMPLAANMGPGEFWIPIAPAIGS
jgi:hypothetical protein